MKLLPLLGSHIPNKEFKVMARKVLTRLKSDELSENFNKDIYIYKRTRVGRIQ